MTIEEYKAENQDLERRLKAFEGRLLTWEEEQEVERLCETTEFNDLQIQKLYLAS